MTQRAEKSTYAELLAASITDSVATRTAAREVSAEVGNAVVDLRDKLVIDLTSTRALLDGTEGLLAAPAWKLAIKRLVDIAASLIFIIVLLPVMIAAAIAVKLSSRGPVLFLQDRVGKNGETFRFAKYRSMFNGAHEELDDLNHLNDVDGPVFKMREDPRVTPVGRFMRKYSIDELPQLFHVLAGRMSLVGPRPPLPAEVATYDEWERQRLLTKPGITCIWQISGRSDLDFETWVTMDVEYIATWRPWLDFKIMLGTIPAVVSGRGAY